MGQNTTKFVRCYFKLKTCFGPRSGPSSGHKSIYSRKLYSISHKIYQPKILRDLVLNCKLYYQQLHLKYLRNLASYRLYKPPEDDTIVSKHVEV